MARGTTTAALSAGAARYTCRGLDGPGSKGDEADEADEPEGAEKADEAEEADAVGAGAGPVKSAHRGRPDWVSAKLGARSAESDDAETTKVKSKGGAPEGKGKGSQVKGKRGSAKGGAPGQGRGSGRGR